MDDFLCFYLQSYIILPAAVLVSFLSAYDCFTCLLLRNTRSRGGTYWLCCSQPLFYFDLLIEPNFDEATENQIEQRCLWYQVHIAPSGVDSLKKRTSQKQDKWRQITKTIYSGNTKNPVLELNPLLWMIIKCCMIRLQETPKFLHEDYPQPRCVLYGFLLHSTPLLLNLDSETKAFLCGRLESLLSILGLIQVHGSGFYSVRRLFRKRNLSLEMDFSELPSWRFDFWMFLRKKYCRQIDPMLFPRLALHLGVNPSISLQLLSKNEVAVSYIKRSGSLIEASRRFVRDLSDASDACGKSGRALCCLHEFDTVFLDSVPQPICDEVSMPCDDADNDSQDAVHSQKQFSDDLDFIGAQSHIASTYLTLGAHEKGLQRLDTICESLDEIMSKILKDVSHSVRSLALVAWARSAGKKQTSQESKESQQPGYMRLIGEQLFSVHVELKRSPTKRTLLATSARLGDALSDWKREFVECSTPPYWNKCRNEIICLIQASRIGFQALDLVSTHFFADDVNNQLRADFAWIFSTLSKNISNCH